MSDYPRYDVEAVKATVSVPDALERYGDLSKRRGNRCPCPIHGGKDNNLSFRNDSFHCFVCGAGGDVITLVEKIFNLSFPDAVRKLAEDPTLLDAEEGENGGAQTANADGGTPELRATMDRLTEYFGTQVKIKRGKKKGKIEIDYYGDEDLERILELLHGGAGSTAASAPLSPEEAEAEEQRKIEELRKFSTQGFTV